MRKSISVAFFSIVATLMLMGIAVMGCSEMILFSQYFAEERYATLDGVAKVTEQAAGYFWQELDQMPAAEQEGLVSKVDLIGQSADVHIFFTDKEGKVVLASNQGLLADGQLSATVLEEMEQLDEDYHAFSMLGGTLLERSYVAARPVSAPDGSRAGAETGRAAT